MNSDHAIATVLIILCALAILAVPVISYIEVRKERRNGK